MKKVALVLCNDMHMDIANANILLSSIMQNDGYEVTGDYTIADIVIVNTCAFGPNKMYSVRVLADVRINAKPSAQVIATGCLLKLNLDELKAIPNIEVKSFEELISFFGCSKELKSIIPQNKVIISTGCLHKCSYCVYPLICGKYKSKPMETILDEIGELYKTESTIYITGAQETSDYGIDLYGKRTFSELLEKVVTMYPNSNYVIGWFHPSGLSDEVIQTIAKFKNIIEIMLHVQHVNSKILNAMARPSIEGVNEKIRLLKTLRPDLIISTEVIVGFPGETKRSFNELIRYLKKGYFNDIGVASYEAVLGTKASVLPNQVEKSVKLQRMNYIKETFNATCYPADENSGESVIEEYIKACRVLGTMPANILIERQKYEGIAGIDTSDKLENFETHLKTVYKLVVESRSSFDFSKNKKHLAKTYTLEARKLFCEIIQRGDFKPAIKQRTQQLLLE